MKVRGCGHTGRGVVILQSYEGKGVWSYHSYEGKGVWSYCRASYEGKVVWPYSRAMEVRVCGHTEGKGCGYTFFFRMLILTKP